LERVEELGARVLGKELVRLDSLMYFLRRLQRMRAEEMVPYLRENLPPLLGVDGVSLYVADEEHLGFFRLIWDGSVVVDLSTFFTFISRYLERHAGTILLPASVGELADWGRSARGGEHPRVLLPPLEEGVRSPSLTVVLRSNGDLPAIMELRKADGIFSPSMVDWVDLAQGCVASIISSKLRLERIENLYMRDFLTGIYNRRFFADFYRKQFERYLRYGEVFSVAMMDIDDFKGVNDSYGHIFGDFVLKRLAQALQNGIRASDLVARYGGEEFSFVFSNTPSREALLVCDRLVRAVESLEFEVGGARVPVTVSCGVFGMDQECVLEPFEALDRADAALYEAKRAGKNRAVLWRPGMKTPFSRGER